MYQLTQSEMLLLMGLADADAVLGVQNLPEADSEEMAGLLEEAKTSLLSRGLLRTSPGGDMYLEPSILEVVTVCAQPGVSLVATYTAEGEVDECFIHYSLDTIVEDKVLEGGIRNLSVVDSADEVLPRVVEFLHLEDQPAVTAEGFTIPRTTLEQVRGSAAEGAEAVAGLLQAEGVSREAAASFARAFAGPISIAAFGLMEYEDDQAAMGPNLALLEVTEGLWCMETTRKGESDQVDITPYDAQAAESRVGRYVDWIHGQM
jgi:hypothetical protein